MTNATAFTETQIRAMSYDQLTQAADRVLQYPYGSAHETLTLLPDRWHVTILHPRQTPPEEQSLIIEDIELAFPDHTYEQVADLFDQEEAQHRSIYTAIIDKNHLINPPRDNNQYRSLLIAGTTAARRQLLSAPSRIQRMCSQELEQFVCNIDHHLIYKQLTVKMTRDYQRHCFDAFADIANSDRTSAIDNLHAIADLIQPPPTSIASRRRRRALTVIMPPISKLLTFARNTL